MSINVSELVITIINFVLLLFLLNHFLYKPVMRFMDERKERIQAGLEEEAQAKQELDRCEDELRQELSKQNQKARELIAESKRNARTQCAAMYREANAAAREQKQVVTEQIAQEKTKDYAKIESHVPELVALLADHMMLDARDPEYYAELKEKQAWYAKEDELLKVLDKQHQRARELIAESQRNQRNKRAKQAEAYEWHQYEIPSHIQARMPELIGILTDRILQDDQAAAQHHAEIKQCVDAAQANA